MNPIPYGRQSISTGDINAVVETLKSDYLTQGPRVLEFENAFADYVGSEYAVAVANGTAALHLCCLALGVQPGDKIITTPITFAATANCIRYCGGEVVFADIDKESLLLDINAVKELLDSAPPNTYKGIIPVDFSGLAVNLEAFNQLALEHDLWIIEDACHAPGGNFIDSSGNVQSCGNGTFADLAIFSFHPVKHIATAEGGMITTNDVNLYNQLTKLRTHGITKNSDDFENDATLLTSEKEDGESWPEWYMEMQDLGYNYRLSDIHAALGLSQLKRANDGLERRREIAKRYADVFSNVPFVKGQSGNQIGHAYHLYILEVENRLGLFNYLREYKIFAQIHYIPTHLMPYYKQFGWKEGDFPRAESYYQGCISLPMFPSLSDEEQEFVISTILSFYNK